MYPVEDVVSLSATIINPEALINFPMDVFNNDITAGCKKMYITPSAMLDIVYEIEHDTVNVSEIVSPRIP